MFNFQKSSGSLLKRLQAAGAFKMPVTADAGDPLDETVAFGDNPGQLRMFSYMPDRVAAPALVVVLHGCGQTAASYNHGAGWSTLAERYGFALLMPEQQRSNNPNGCFNWFQREDATRGRGEAASIRQMVEAMIRDKGCDPRQVFVTGLSAGGAMTSVMLACYPETFAAGAIIAGLPYGAASTVKQAFQSMFQCPPRPATEWGDLVRAAAPRQDGPWPRVSVWHGNADKTVIPSNAREIVKQWTNVHRLADAPSKQDVVDSYPRQVWLGESGEELVESYTITDMAHGTPLATGNAESECGIPGPYLLEVGISSSFHIAKFFGVTRNGARPRKENAKTSTRPAPLSVQRELTDFGAPEATLREEARVKSTGSHLDIGAVITAALTKAGLMPRR
jgi:poly(hydroxyalkanoate) depolymerase family esterase